LIPQEGVSTMAGCLRLLEGSAASSLRFRPQLPRRLALDLFSPMTTLTKAFTTGGLATTAVSPVDATISINFFLPKHGF